MCQVSRSLIVDPNEWAAQWAWASSSCARPASGPGSGTPAAWTGQVTVACFAHHENSAAAFVLIKPPLLLPRARGVAIALGDPRPRPRPGHSSPWRPGHFRAKEPSRPCSEPVVPQRGSGFTFSRSPGTSSKPRRRSAGRPCPHPRTPQRRPPSHRLGTRTLVAAPHHHQLRQHLAELNSATPTRRPEPARVREPYRGLARRESAPSERPVTDQSTEVRQASQRSRAASADSNCSTGHALVVVVREERVAGAEVHGRRPRARRTGRRRSSRTWRRPAPRAPRRTPAPPGRSRPGRAPGAASMTHDVVALEQLAARAAAPPRPTCRARSGSSP